MACVVTTKGHKVVSKYMMVLKWKFASHGDEVFEVVFK
jgi:hypothetical protein